MIWDIPIILTPASSVRQTGGLCFSKIDAESRSLTLQAVRDLFTLREMELTMSNDAQNGFIDVQNGFYNALTKGLGLSRDTFQILQPSPPLPPDNDDAIWNYFNNIPPLSLTQNYITSGGNQFFSNYKALISFLRSIKNTIEQDIGEENYASWISYLASLPQKPTASQLPDTFFNWAIVQAPDVANVGAADYSAILLDPISSAGLDLMIYRAGNASPDWTVGYTGLKALLPQAPRMSFSLVSDSMDSAVSNTWTFGRQSGFFGLWSNDYSSSSYSATFASSHFSVSAAFDNVLTFQATPKSWYSSAAMGVAYNNRTSPPWQDVTNWERTFDPQIGNMSRFMTSLIVVSGMNITVESEASFSDTDQRTI